MKSKLCIGIILTSILVLIFVTACNIFLVDIEDDMNLPDITDDSTKNEEVDEENDKVESNQSEENQDTYNDSQVVDIDFEKIKPNEASDIMIVMFHNFVETFTPRPYDDGEYTTTFSEFENLLQRLYDSGYRLISMLDYLKNNINVPAGCTPIVFTFDDGTSGQFNLVEVDEELVVNKNSAVGIMEEFYERYPDFGLAGTFYINLGNSTFAGAGTLEDRLNYLIEKGFEIGNHTYTHIDPADAQSEQQIIREMGMNQKRMDDFMPGYVMKTLALPFGNTSQRFAESVIRGEFEGIPYENKGILFVGANPAKPSITKTFNPHRIPRVRSNGINPEKYDLDWWLDYLERNPSGRYVSDGNKNTVTVPEKHAGSID